MIRPIVFTLCISFSSFANPPKMSWVQERLQNAKILIQKARYLVPEKFSSKSIERVEIGSEESENDDLVTYYNVEAAKNMLSTIAEVENRKIINKIKRGETLAGSDLTIMHQIVATFLEVQHDLKKLENSSNEMISLISRLDRFEVLDNTYTDYYALRKFRRLINDSDSSYDIQAHEISKLIRSILKKDYIYTTIEDFNDFALSYNEKRLMSNNDELKDKIKNHPAVNILKEHRKLVRLARKYRNKERLDKFFDLGIEITHLLSKAFGNGTGAVRWREGHLFKRDKLNQEILDELQPLDIITEKTYFALTDTFIPGHFGHNAIWLGTEDQLKEIGMWYHPSIVKYHNEIEQGLSIIETDRSGTHLKTLEDFMNVDEFAILRVRDNYLTPEKMENVFEVALAQIGKTYDFNFDVETTDQLVCSELLYQSFGDVKWPTQKWPGRMAISPDDVTSLALYENSPVELVYYVAQRKKGDYKYKTKDDLAKDLGYKRINDGYYSSTEDCKYKRVGRKRKVRGSVVNRYRKEKVCETSFSKLAY